MPGSKPPALNHEVADHAVEDRVVVVTGLDVGKKVGDGLRCALGVEFKRDDAVVGVQFDHVNLRWNRRVMRLFDDQGFASTTRADWMTIGVSGTF
jgi:hypothetical protein